MRSIFFEINRLEEEEKIYINIIISCESVRLSFFYFYLKLNDNYNPSINWISMSYWSGFCCCCDLMWIRIQQQNKTKQINIYYMNKWLISIIILFLKLKQKKKKFSESLDFWNKISSCSYKHAITYNTHFC